MLPKGASTPQDLGPFGATTIQRTNPKPRRHPPGFWVRGRASRRRPRVLDGEEALPKKSEAKTLEAFVFQRFASSPEGPPKIEDGRHAKKGGRQAQALSILPFGRSPSEGWPACFFFWNLRFRKPSRRTKSPSVSVSAIRGDFDCPCNNCRRKRKTAHSRAFLFLRRASLSLPPV